MTTTSIARTTPPRPLVLDVAATPRVPLGRLVGVELRKLVDTRAGLWQLVATAVITLAALVIFALAAPSSEHGFVAFLTAAATPQGFLLPVMGILLVTGEWSQRTALVTFTLEPHRWRVVVAKVVASLLAGLVAIAVALGLAVVATVVAGNSTAWDDVTAATVGKFLTLEISWVLQGLAFGLLFLASATAIVTYFVVPNAFTFVAELWKGLAGVRPWIDQGFAQLALYGPSMSGEQWAQLGTSTALWVLLPFGVGLARVLRAEVK